MNMKIKAMFMSLVSLLLAGIVGYVIGTISAKLSTETNTYILFAFIVLGTGYLLYKSFLNNLMYNEYKKKMVDK